MYNMQIALAGTLMNRNIPPAKFSIECDSPQEFIQLAPRGFQWPFEMQLECDGWTLIDALKERVVPPSRQGIYEALLQVGIDGYDISKILHHQNASCWDDPYWVRFDGEGPQTWEGLCAKIGYSVVR